SPGRDHSVAGGRDHLGIGGRHHSVTGGRLHLVLGGAIKRNQHGGGVSYVDARPGDDINTFMLPAYARVDGMASYNFKPTWLWPFAPNLTLQVNVKNLLGSTYYEGSSTRFNIAPGAPRTFIASVRAEF
ncbi:MAG: TonB-dependent receptor, partial [Alphaproteobacteria bacterium]|nr:TonB-dependent receptor [Alphaproteobacteria bacterium]MBM3654869.1 TonB-dependent receptor [Alphaproteobacteria bacterium]